MINEELKTWESTLMVYENPAKMIQECSLIKSSANEMFIKNNHIPELVKKEDFTHK